MIRLTILQAMKGLEGCVKDMKGEGFFAADIKMPTGSDRKKQVFATSTNYLCF